MKSEQMSGNALSFRKYSAWGMDPGSAAGVETLELLQELSDWWGKVRGNGVLIQNLSEMWPCALPQHPPPQTYSKCGSNYPLIPVSETNKGKRVCDLLLS